MAGQDYFYRKFFCPMKSRIIFNGMNRHASPATAQPGDCSSVVNLRKQSDHLIPVGSPQRLYSTQEKDHRLLYVHTCYATTANTTSRPTTTPSITR